MTEAPHCTDVVLRDANQREVVAPDRSAIEESLRLLDRAPFPVLCLTSGGSVLEAEKSQPESYLLAFRANSGDVSRPVCGTMDTDLAIEVLAAYAEGEASWNSRLEWRKCEWQEGALIQVPAISKWLSQLMANVESGGRHLPQAQRRWVLRRLVRDGIRKGFLRVAPGTQAEEVEVRFEIEQLVMALVDEAERNEFAQG